MKITPNYSTTTEISVKKKKKVEHRLIGRIKPRPGHILFEINPQTRAVVPAEYKTEATFVLGQSKLKENKKVITKPGMVYISALNQANALKRYNQGKGSAGININKNQLAL